MRLHPAKSGRFSKNKLRRDLCFLMHFLFWADNFLGTIQAEQQLLEGFHWQVEFWMWQNTMKNIWNTQRCVTSMTSFLRSTFHAPPKVTAQVVFNAMTDSNIDSHHLSRTLKHLDWSIWTLMASGFTVSPLHLPFESSFWVPAAWKEVKFHVFSGVPCLSWMNSKTSWYKLQLSCKTDSTFSKDLVASSGLKISCNGYIQSWSSLVCYNRGPNLLGIHSLYGMRNFSPRCHRGIWKVD